LKGVTSIPPPRSISAAFPASISRRLLPVRVVPAGRPTFRFPDRVRAVADPLLFVILHGLSRLLRRRLTGDIG
jgi:hypothetical protein